MNRIVTLAAALFALTALAEAAKSPEEVAKKAFAPLPKQYDSKTNPITPEKVTLGRMLYFEKRLSKNHDVSCASCHSLDKYGVDGKQFSVGHKKQLGGRNSPTVYNAGNHVAQFWDGRAATLEDQAKGPVSNPVEMAMTDAAAVEKVLRSIPGYAEPFKKAFPDDKEPVTFDNMAKAIGAFERGLVTPGKLDKFLAGDAKALTDAEKKGLLLFDDVGCGTCHQGASVGGTTYQKLGAVEEVPGLKDEGRFAVTKDAADKYFFRVPGLRNIEKTGPYGHDGSKKTLDEQVVFMAKHQLGRALKPDEVKSLVTFLKALTGDLPKAYIKEPKLPPSGKDTPKPDPS